MTSTRLAALVLALFAAGPAWSWQFKSTSDPMGRGTRYEATVTSSNSVNFPFPYAGAQRALLVLRSGPGRPLVENRSRLAGRRTVVDVVMTICHSVVMGSTIPPRLGSRGKG